MFLKKFWLKLTNNSEYKEVVNKEKRKKDILQFKKSNHETILNNIRQKIKDKKQLNFLHSGHSADIINVLPVIKQLSINHECNLFITMNKPIDFYFKHPAGKYYINERMFQMLFPLLKNQPYLNKVEKFTKQNIDIDFDLLRKLPINLLFDNATYGSVVTGVNVNLNEPFLTAEHHIKFKKKIIIQRTFRYRNDLISYDFLNDYKDLLFVGTNDEYEDLKSVVKNLEFYDCKDFLDMAKIVKSSKFVVANSSITFPIAEGLQVPRLLESSPLFPAAQPHGKNAFNFYFQSDFEEKFNFLNKLI